MVQAPVGFHCPDCVASARRTTRQARNAFGGIRSLRPGSASVVIIVVNVAVWLALLLTGGARGALYNWLVLSPTSRCRVGQQVYVGVPQGQCASIGTWFPGVADGAWWQLITSAFSHTAVLHIGFNMLAIWFLGPQLEHALGRARYLAVFFVAALSGSVAVYALSDVRSSTLGASGAVFGLMGALLLISMRSRADIKSIAIWLVASIAMSFFSPGVSWQGHVGGLLGGLAVAAIFAYAPRRLGRGPVVSIGAKDRRPLIQWAGTAVVVALLLVAVALRTVALG